MIAQTEHALSVAGTSSTDSGFWLDEVPELGIPESNIDDLYVAVPLRDGAVDLSEAVGVTYSARTLNYVLRGVFTTAAACVAAEAALRAKFANASRVAVTDTLTGRSFTACTCRGWDASYNAQVTECTINVTFVTPNAYDSNGAL